MANKGYRVTEYWIQFESNIPNAHKGPCGLTQSIIWACFCSFFGVASHAIWLKFFPWLLFIKEYYNHISPGRGFWLEGKGKILRKTKMKLTEYLKETRNEMSHVTWPSRRQTIAYSSLVIAISLAVAALLGAFDYIFSHLLTLLF